MEGPGTPSWRLQKLGEAAERLGLGDKFDSSRGPEHDFIDEVERLRAELKDTEDCFDEANQHIVEYMDITEQLIKFCSNYHAELYPDIQAPDFMSMAKTTIEVEGVFGKPESAETDE